jgi:hypothetical protein
MLRCDLPQPVGDPSAGGAHIDARAYLLQKTLKIPTQMIGNGLHDEDEEHADSLEVIVAVSFDEAIFIEELIF